MTPGDHLTSPRTGYTHHGLYMGNNEVIHYGGYTKIKSEGVITITSLDEFSQGQKIHIKHHLTRRFTNEESIDRARTRLGEDWYQLLFNNCEHFVMWAIDGIPVSNQVNTAVLGAIGCAALAKSATKKIGSSVALGSLANSVSNVSLLSGGTATGLTSLVSAATGVSAGSGILAGAASLATPLAPIAAAVAVGCLFEYGIRKIFD